MEIMMYIYSRATEYCWHIDITKTSMVSFQILLHEHIYTFLHTTFFVV